MDYVVLCRSVTVDLPAKINLPGQVVYKLGVVLFQALGSPSGL